MRGDDLVRAGTSTVLVGAHSRAVRNAKPWPRIDRFTCYEQGLISGECLSTGIWVRFAKRPPGCRLLFRICRLALFRRRPGPPLAADPRAVDGNFTLCLDSDLALRLG